MKTKIFMSMLVIALAAALVGGATMAWFTDTATNPGNTFTAGTIDIVLQDHPDDIVETPIFNFTNIAPGWESGVVTVNVQNAGSLPMKVRGVVSGTTVTAADKALYAALDGQYKLPGMTAWSAWYAAPALPLTRALPLIPAGTTVTVELQFRLPDDTGNAAQGGSVTLDLTLTATQTDNPGWTELGGE